MSKKVTKRREFIFVLIGAVLISVILTFGVARIHYISTAHAARPSNISNLEIVWNTFTFPGGVGTVSCPTGKVAIAGGANVGGSGFIQSSHPVGPGITGNSGDVIGSSSNDTGWTATVNNIVLGNTFSVYAVCATAQ